MNAKGEVNFELIQQGDLLPELQIKMERETYFAYNRLIKNMNPLHSDKSYANRLGYRDIVVAGVYTFSFIPKMIEDWAGAAAKVSGIEIKYGDPIYLGETITQQARVTKKSSAGGKKLIECEVLVRDHAGALLTSAIVVVDFS